MVTCTDCGGAVLHRRLFGACIRCGAKLSPKELSQAKANTTTQRTARSAHAITAAADKASKKQAAQAATEAHARALKEERTAQLLALAALARPPAEPPPEPVPTPDEPPTEIQYPLPAPPPYVEPIFEPVPEDIVYEAYAPPKSADTDS